MENTDMNETYFDNMYRACKCDYLNWKSTDPITVSPIVLDIAREFLGIYTKNDYSNTKGYQGAKATFYRIAHNLQLCSCPLDLIPGCTISNMAKYSVVAPRQGFRCKNNFSVL